MLSWNVSPSNITVQLIVRSDSNVVTCSKYGLVGGKVKVGVGNAIRVLESNIAVVADVKVEDLALVTVYTIQ